MTDATATRPSGSTSSATGRDWVGPAAITGGVVAAAALGGLATAPGTDWFEQLDQPSWAPPNSAFAPVWTALYVLIAASLSWTWRQTPPEERKPLAILTGSNLALNAAWTLIFFRGQSPLAAGVEIVVLEGTTVALIVLAAKRSRVAALALVPYALWVAFATALTWAIWSMNR